MVVYTTDDGEFGAVAERIATDRDESVTSDLGVALESDEPVVYVDDPSNVVEQPLQELQQRLLDRGPETGAFGVITGYTPEQAEDLYFPGEASNGEDTLLFSRHPPDDLPDPPNTTVFEKDDVTASRLQDLTDEKRRSFEIESGGRPIHITLDEGFICGFPRSVDVDDYADPQPYCVSGSELDCPLTDELVRAEDIDAEHFFLVSCASTIDNGTGGFPVHAPTGLLDGAESLIGSYRVAMSRPHELLLHHSLLAAGYDVSERCYLLTRHAHLNNIMSLPYISFGRPDARVADPHDPAFDLEIDSESRASLPGEALSVRLTDLDAHVADFRIPESQVPDYDDRLWIRSQTDTDERVYYSAFPEGDDVRVLVCTGGRMQFDELELTVDPYPARYLERAMGFDAARNVDRTAEMGFLTTKANEQADQLRNQLRSFPERTVAETYDAGAHEDVESKLGSLHGHVNAIREELLASLRSHSDFLYYIYGRNGVGDDVYPGETCTICGERPTFIKQISGWSGHSAIPGRSGDAKRLLSSCPQCGHLFDVPATGRDPDPTYPLVRGKLDADGPRHQPVEIEFTNTEDAPVQATFQPLLLHMDNEDNQFFDPERRDAVLLPGETHTAEFTIDTALFPDNMYYILGVVLANLDVYAGFETTVLGGEAEYYPRQLR
jgi:hypothetical protein